MKVTWGKIKQGKTKYKTKIKIMHGEQRLFLPSPRREGDR
jgi:hypothetical protein